MNTEMNIENIYQNIKKYAENGTVRYDLVKTLNNDINTFKVLVGGIQIFSQIAQEVSRAKNEVLIQTFAWDSKIIGVEWLKNALENRNLLKSDSDEVLDPLNVYIQIDERGSLANYAFSGSIPTKWDVTAKSIGLDIQNPLVNIYVSVYHHNSIASNHGKTVIIDNKILIITGANFQSSNFHHIPAHDAAYLIRGDVAKAARDDFVYMWKLRSDSLKTPDLIDNYIDTNSDTNSDTNIDTNNVDTNMDIDIDIDINKFTLLLVTRQPQIIASYDIIDNPQNSAIDTLLSIATKVIRIATPNLNCRFVIDKLIEFVNNGGTVELLLGKGFNEKRENPFVGGTNQSSVNTILNRIHDDCINNISIRWFSLDGKNAIVGNVAGASHLKFMNIDNRFLFCGNANLDVVSCEHSHEVNFVMDSTDLCRYATDRVFTEYFAKGIPVTLVHDNIERFKNKVGIRSMQGFLATRYTSKILDIKDEGSGYKTYKLSRPDNFEFLPGQYINIRSGNKFSSIIKQPVSVAIASGTNDLYIEVTCRDSFLSWKPNHALYKSNSSESSHFICTSVKNRSNIFLFRMYLFCTMF